MPTQISIDDLFKQELTSRQWKRYDFIKETTGRKFANEEEELETYEFWLLTHGGKTELSYGYFEDKLNGYQRNNMASIRAWRKDKRALREADIIYKIITNTGLTSSPEIANAYLQKKFFRIMGELKLYWIEKKKLEKNLQTRLTFNSEKDTILAVFDKESK